MHTYIHICTYTRIVHIVSVCIHTRTHTMVSLETKFSSGNLNPAKSLSVTFLPPEAKPHIAFFLHSFRNPEQEHRLNRCFETTMLSGKRVCAQEHGKQQRKLSRAPPPTRNPCRHQCTPDGVTEAHCHSS